MRRQPGWGRRAAVVAVVVQALALPAAASANYGGNTYGNVWITYVVVGIMAAVALGVAIWYGVRSLLRARADRNRPYAAAGSGNTPDYVENRRAESVAAAPETGNIAELVEEMNANAARRQLGVQGAPLVIGASAAKPDTADELTKLATLRDLGVLTEAEFSAQKAKLLAED